MMKFAFLSFLYLFLCISAEAQTPYQNKKKKKDYFGKKENPNDKVRPWGLQVQLGPTYTFTKSNSKNETVKVSSDTAGDFQYTHDPMGRVGVFGEIGFVHFNMKSPKYKFGRLIDYIDYGIGFKLLVGKETTTLDRIDPFGNVVGSAVGVGEFYNGNIFGRFGVHKLQYLNKTKNIFLDHSLGLNADFRITGGSENYKAPVIASTQRFAAPFSFQMHYDIGFGIRLGKGKYLIPGIQLPLLGFHEWNGGTPAFKWFSSKYYPVMFHIKYIRLFPAKQGKGCYQGDPADKKSNELYMQSM